MMCRNASFYIYHIPLKNAFPLDLYIGYLHNISSIVTNDITLTKSILTIASLRELIDIYRGAIDELLYQRFLYNFARKEMNRAAGGL